MKTINKLENGRAEFAFKCAEEGANLSKKKEYKSYVKKIPMLIKTNGFGATIAFIFSKMKNNKDDTYNLIYKQITDWFKDERNPFKFEINELAKDICIINSQEYRAITTETLALFTWIRRFAEGLIEGE